MSDEMNPSIAAVTEEIRVREQELEALRAALTVLQSNREPRVRILASTSGKQFAISSIFEGFDNNGRDAIDPTVLPMADTKFFQPKTKKSAASGRESTARLLALFDRQRARSLAEVAAEAGVPTRHIAIGVLLKHGYLKAKGEGYVRTAKDYVP